MDKVPWRKRRKMLIIQSKDEKERNESRGAGTHFLADVDSSSVMTGGQHVHNIYPMPTKRVRRQRTSAVTTPKANSTVPPIYRLPNEVLLLIFILVLLPDGNPHYANLVPIPPYPTTRGDVKPILVLRWVSIWFRKIASHPTLWLHDDFDIRSIRGNQI
jgi:hypothetical protein